MGGVSNNKENSYTENSKGLSRSYIMEKDGSCEYFTIAKFKGEG